MKGEQRRGRCRGVIRNSRSEIEERVVKRKVEGRKERNQAKGKEEPRITDYSKGGR